MAKIQEQAFEDTAATRVQAEPQTRPPSAGNVLTNAREACSRSIMFIQHCRKAYTQLQHPKQSLLKIQYGDAYKADEVPTLYGSRNRSWAAGCTSAFVSSGVSADPDEARRSNPLAFASAPFRRGNSNLSNNSFACDSNNTSAPPDGRLGPHARHALLSYRRRLSAPTNQDLRSVAAASAAAAIHTSATTSGMPLSSDDNVDSMCSNWTARPALSTTATAPTQPQPQPQSRPPQAASRQGGLTRAWTSGADSLTPTQEVVSEVSAAFAVQRNPVIGDPPVARPHPPYGIDHRRLQRPYRRSTADAPPGPAPDTRLSMSEGSGGGGAGVSQYGSGGGRTARGADAVGSTITDMQDSDGTCSSSGVVPPACRPSSRRTSTASGNAPTFRCRSASPELPGAAHVPGEPAVSAAAGKSSGGSRSASPPPIVEGKRRRRRPKPQSCGTTRSTSMSYLIRSADRPPWRMSKPDKPPARQRRQDAAELRSLSLRRLPMRSSSAYQSPTGWDSASVGPMLNGGGAIGSCTTSRPYTADRSWHSFTTSSAAAVLSISGSAGAVSSLTRVNRNPSSVGSLSSLVGRRTPANAVMPHTVAVPHTPVDTPSPLGKDRQGRLPALDVAYAAHGTQGHSCNGRRSLDEGNLDVHLSRKLGHGVVAYLPYKGASVWGVGGAPRRAPSGHDGSPLTRGGRMAVGSAVSTAGGNTTLAPARFASALHISTESGEGGNAKEGVVTRLSKALHDLWRTDAR